MNIGVVGCGHVGVSVVAGMLELGHDVIAVDQDPSVVSNIENATVATEPAANSTLHDYEDDYVASTDPTTLDDRSIVFIALPTPAGDDGSLDTSVIEEFVDAYRHTLSGTILAVKSTVPVGFTQWLGRDTFAAGHNPEFLREGLGPLDFEKNHRFIFGGTDEFHAAMHNIYRPHPLYDEDDVHFVDHNTAELAKLANNAYLASKISLANELGVVANEFGVDGLDLMEMVTEDMRIDSAFTRPGPSWGGSCLPKDVAGLRNDTDSATPMLDGADEVNQRQVTFVADKLIDETPLGKKMGIFGLGFKEDSNNAHQSLAVSVAQYIEDEYGLGSRELLVTNEPATSDFISRVPGRVTVKSKHDVVEDAEAILVVHPNRRFMVDYGDTTVIDVTGELRGQDNVIGLCW